MTLTPLETILSGAALSLVVAMVGRFWGNRVYMRRDSCKECQDACEKLRRLEESRKELEGSSLARDIRWLMQCVRLLCEKNGISVREQIELERGKP